MTTVIGEGDLYYFKQGAWRSLTGPVIASGGTVTDIVDGNISYRFTRSPRRATLWCCGVGRWSTSSSQVVVVVVLLVLLVTVAVAVARVVFFRVPPASQLARSQLS
jgi:hypothetical protein